MKNHVATTEWIKSETHHYHKCATDKCTEILDSAKHTFNSVKTCTVCGYVTTALFGTEISSSVYDINGTNLFVKVSNAQNTFYFGDTLTVADGATFKVYKDITGQTEIGTYMAGLEIGDNAFYITVSNAGVIPKTYIVNVRRRPIYNVTFYTNNGSKVDSQRIEEDFCASIPTQIPTRTGYTFNKWDYDFTTPITDNTTVSADWNTVPYKIIYNLNGGTIEKGNPSTYDIEQNVTLTVNPTKIGYTFAGWSNNGKINKGSTGEKTFTASWSADVKLSSDGKTVTGLNNIVNNLVILSEYNGITVTSIGGFAFNGCSSLTNITIPNSVTSIGNWTFGNCSSLTSITVASDNANYKSIDGNLYSKDGKTLIQYAIGKKDTSFIIPDGVTSIGSNAFEYCRNLTSITIPDSVTSIGDSAFA